MLIRMLELCTKLTKPTNCRPNLLQCTGSYHLCAEISPVEWDHRSTCGSHHLCADQKPEFFDISDILPAKVVTMDHIIFVQKSPSVTWGHGSTRGSHHLFADHIIFLQITTRILHLSPQDHRSVAAHFFLFAVGL